MVGPCPPQIQEGGRAFRFPPLQTPFVADGTAHNGDKMIASHHPFPIRSPSPAAPIGPRLPRLFGPGQAIHHRYSPGPA